jgi:hypothetical protein
MDIPQNSPPEEGCDLPRYIVGLMFGSDETVLAQFGTAKLWPLYMFYANDSKYDRAKLGLHLIEHLAYLSKVCYRAKLSPAFVLTSLSGTAARRIQRSLHCTLWWCETLPADSDPLSARIVPRTMEGHSRR